MAKNDTPAAATAAPAFISRPMTAIPKKPAPNSGVDLERAKLLLGFVFADGAPISDTEGNTMTASDGVAYADKAAARGAANKAKRLLGHVKPDGFNTVTRVYQPEGVETWEWALWMEAAKPATK